MGKRLQLTDEEVALIEAKRRDEAKFNLGWNAALDAVFARANEEALTYNEAIVFLNELKKVVRP